MTAFRSFGVRKFRRLLLVGTFSVLAQFFMGFLGSTLAGNLLGEDALSGVSLLLPIGSALSFGASLFGVGMGICYSSEIGLGNKRRAHELFSQGLWSVCLIGVLLSAALLFGSSLWLDFFAPADAVRTAAEAYCRVYWAVPVVEMLSVFLLNACFADGDDILCYWAYAMQLGVNLGVAYLGIRFGGGTTACAWGVLAGFAASGVVLACHFVRSSNSIRLVRHFCWRDLVAIARRAFGDASYYFFNALMIFIFEKYVIAQYGSGLLPVLTVLIATIGLLDVFGGIGAAAQPIVSVYLGEKNTRAAREVMHDAMRLGVVEGLVATAILLVFPRAAIALVGISDPSLVETASRAIRLFSCGCLVLSLANILNGYYIIIDRGLLSTGVSFFTWLAFPVLALFALGPLGPSGAWLATGVGPIVAFLLILLFLAVREGRAMCPLLLPRDREGKLAMWSLELTPERIVATAAAIAERLAAERAAQSVVVRARLLVEEVLMLVREKNAAHRVLAEVTLDLNEGARLTLRDDGEIFDITDADQRISSFRAYIIGTMMASQKRKENLIATGFNRNTFQFSSSGGSAV